MTLGYPVVYLAKMDISVHKGLLDRPDRKVQLDHLVNKELLALQEHLEALGPLVHLVQ